jgi:hypothetical protein
VPQGAELIVTGDGGADPIRLPASGVNQIA